MAHSPQCDLSSCSAVLPILALVSRVKGLIVDVIILASRIRNKDWEEDFTLRYDIQLYIQRNLRQAKIFDFLAGIYFTTHPHDGFFGGMGVGRILQYCVQHR